MSCRRARKGFHLPAGLFVAMERAYINYAEMERLTREKVCYVTKMKKNLAFRTLSSTTLVTSDGQV